VADFWLKDKSRKTFDVILSTKSIVFKKFGFGGRLQPGTSFSVCAPDALLWEETHTAEPVFPGHHT
jgi:hypothetical protein